MSSEYGISSGESPTKWSTNESTLLSCLMRQLLTVNNISDAKELSHFDWQNLAQQFPGKNVEEIKVKWQLNAKSPKYKKSANWTLAEDEILQNLVAKLGTKRWQCIANEVNANIWQGRQVRKGKQ